MSLPTSAKERKTYPLYSGLLQYFPDASTLTHASYVERRMELHRSSLNGVNHFTVILPTTQVFGPFLSVGSGRHPSQAFLIPARTDTRWIQ